MHPSNSLTKQQSIIASAPSCSASSTSTITSISSSPRLTYASAASSSQQPQHNMTASEQRQFYEIFRLVDRNNSGTITKDELSNLFQLLRTPVSISELDLLFHELDENDDGEIDFEEFCIVMTLRIAAKHTAEEVRDAFKSLASTQDQKKGVIDLSIIEQALNSPALFAPSIGASATEIAESNERIRAALSLLNQLHVDYQGKFDFQKFVSSAMTER